MKSKPFCFLYVMLFYHVTIIKNFVEIVIITSSSVSQPSVEPRCPECCDVWSETFCEFVFVFFQALNS